MLGRRVISKVCLVGFNQILSCKIALFLNEMEGSSGIKFKERLKDLCTTECHSINAKFEKAIRQKNYTRLFVNSNNDGCINVDVNDRRYVVVSTGFKLVGDTEFWTEYYNNLESSNWQKSLYSRLMDIDLSSFNIKDVPYSAEYEVMREKNVPPLFDYMKQIITNQQYNGFVTHVEKSTQKTMHLIKFKDFFKQYKNYLEDMGINPDYQIKATTIKQKLMTANNSFIADKLIRQNDKTERWSQFDMKAFDRFLNKFVFNEKQEGDVIDINDTTECVSNKNKNIKSSEQSTSESGRDKYNTHLLAWS